MAERLACAAEAPATPTGSRKPGCACRACRAGLSFADQKDPGENVALDRRSLLATAMIAVPAAALGMRRVEAAVTPPPGATPMAAWPHQISVNGAEVTIYEPQAIDWANHATLRARAAIAVTPAGQHQPFLGTIEVSGTTAVDTGNDVVYFTNPTLLSSSFPSLDTAQAYALQQRLAAYMARMPPKIIPLEYGAAEPEREAGGGRAAQQHPAGDLLQRAAGEPRRLRRRADHGPDRADRPDLCREYQLGCHPGSGRRRRLVSAQQRQLAGRAELYRPLSAGRPAARRLQPNSRTTAISATSARTCRASRWRRAACRSSSSPPSLPKSS